MMRLLYLFMVGISVVVVTGSGIHYLRGGEVPGNEYVFLLLGLMTVLIIFSGYFVFRDTNLFRELNSQLEIKDESYRNIEALNLELRAQRHDFLNHIQILYSLMELKAYNETTDYLNRLYGDVGKMSANIKTGSVAFNALLQAKSNEAESKGILFRTAINTRLDDMNMPDWEVCRVIGNMIDNGFRASKRTTSPVIAIIVKEKITEYEIVIRNTSQPIENKDINTFFSPGFTTKKEGEGHGMGLYISRQLMNKYGNSIHMAYDSGEVVMTVTINKEGQQ